ncbi:MAG: 23S rRNA (adenine(2503)-C(2))-methyltransferase RlmN, partial [Alphaproteobacteria bacterium]|nr:23S rRNA (adenine(2503)-C(2))-methyltransferase RlmN [Alphaproteobacteria bacterium]
MDIATIHAPVTGQVNLIGLSRAELAPHLLGAGIPERHVKMRAQQIWHWMYFRGVQDFDAMSNISRDLRTLFSERFTLARPEITSEQISTDGTRKWLMRFADGKEAETVFIPEDERGTLCVSSQVGCTLNCAFCHTGTQMLVRNLTPAEIIAQMMVARDRLDEWTSENRHLTNIVMMGMGEP